MTQMPDTEFLAHCLRLEVKAKGSDWRLRFDADAGYWCMEVQDADGEWLDAGEKFDHEAACLLEHHLALDHHPLSG